MSGHLTGINKRKGVSDKEKKRIKNTWIQERFWCIQITKGHHGWNMMIKSNEIRLKSKIGVWQCKILSGLFTWAVLMGINYNSIYNKFGIWLTKLF